ncbi:unnamed protein product [Bursaphelenchus okinawaensis]|uniref:Piwi domain-containing protein n=1 Tax=Bursaphelenchus okinawaensis TaxID=465554 RepID=A0A811LFA2_9BILA|nr:unnamed protein product [Bursaphelenchus okinawaensis]CAG9121941.1 unnamed protein product [Bursaphelenchus okinawaensis]
MEEIRKGIEKMAYPSRYEASGKLLCDKLGVKPADGSLPKKLPPGKECAAKEMVKTNIFPMRFTENKTVYLYDLDIKHRKTYMEGASQITRDITVNNYMRADYFRTEAERNSINIMNYAIRMVPQFFGNKDELAYDRRKTLYSLRKLEIGNNNEKIIEIENTNPTEPFPFKVVIVNMRQTGEMELTPEGLKALSETVALEHCLDVITNQGIHRDLDNHVPFPNNVTYMLYPQNYGIERSECPDLAFGTYTAAGAQKTVKILEGSEKPGPAMIIMPRRTPFHNVETVTSKVLNAYPRYRRPEMVHDNHAEIINMLTGLVVYQTHLAASGIRTMQICGIVNQTAESMEIEINGATTRLTQYYWEKYGITLQHPGLPLVTTKSKKKTLLYHPMELLMICDNQRMHEPLPEIVTVLIKICAVLPSVLEKKVYKSATALHLLDNPANKEFGVEVGTKPIHVPGRRLLPPTLLQNPKQAAVFDYDKMSWGIPSYYRPATIETWALYAIDTEGQLNDAVMKTFAQKYYHECKKKGMVLQPPAEIHIYDRHLLAADFKSLFFRAFQAKCQFIVILTNDKDRAVHPEIKAYERRFEIITQNILIKTAMEAAGVTGPEKRKTMENIIHKTNIKNGGLNYSIPTKDLSKDDLYIGITMDAKKMVYQIPLRAELTRLNPAVIGFTANDLNEAFDFTGDFVLQKTRGNIDIDLMVATVSKILERFIKNRGKPPKNVIMYRGSLPESKYELALKYEIPAVNQILKENGVETFAVIVPSKRHNVKLIPSEPKGQNSVSQNLKCGTVVDTKIVSPVVNEFYCLSHVARLGTARIPKYAVIHNDGNLSMDQLQKITYNLSYGHQIINGSVSLPAPIYIAEGFIKRGRMNWMTYVSSSPTPPDSSSDTSSSNSHSFFTHTTDRIAYINSETLRNLRINA